MNQANLATLVRRYLTLTIVHRDQSTESKLTIFYGGSQRPGTYTVRELDDTTYENE